MQWIKEVELVDSVDDLRSSLSIRCISMQNFEILDARVVTLNKVIHISHFKRRITLEEQKAQKEDRLPRSRQIAYLIYEQFWVTGTDDSVENYTDLFTIALRNDDIQEFDSIALDISKGCKIKNTSIVLELYNMDTLQKKVGLDYHRLKTIVKRSIEQNLRMKKLEVRNWNFYSAPHTSFHAVYQRWLIHITVPSSSGGAHFVSSAESSRCATWQVFTLHSSLCSLPWPFLLFFLLLLLEPCFLPFLFHVTSSRQYPTGTPANKSSLSNFERNAVVKNQRVKQREQRRLGLLARKANGQCSNGENCSFHDTNKRAKLTLPNRSPNSTLQNESNASRTRSPRDKSPSGRMFRLSCKDYLKGTERAPLHSVKNGIVQNAFSASLKMDAILVKNALMRIARLKNSQAMGLKKMVTKVQ